MNRELKRVTLVIMGMFVVLFIAASTIQVFTADQLYADERNTRSTFDSYRYKRGAILVAGTPIAESVPVEDNYRYQRMYPNPFVYSNVTGYFTLNQGLTGIEGAMNSYLSGKTGSQFLNQLNAILTGQEPQGASVSLALDPIMQQAAFDALGELEGAVVVTEPSTGKILVMASKPGYDPNLMSSHNADEVIATYDELMANPQKPLIDKSITGDMNPPGSVFKLVMVAAALESGKFTPESTFDNPAQFQLPGTDVFVENSTRTSCGYGAKVTLATALRLSCNIPFAQLGLELGRKAILDQAKKFGFNTSFEIPMKTAASEFPVVMDDPQTALASFGQYDVRATPLQMAMVSAAIANGGVVMYPNVVDSVLEATLKPISQFEPKEFSRALSAENAATITQMMINNVDNSNLITNVRIEGVKVAGKTGTAENGDGEPYTFWFTGFAPADAPRYAITVLVENGGGLGQSGYTNDIAVPIARKVLEAGLNK
jgi:peptidoglycan glycosyltransferase